MKPKITLLLAFLFSFGVPHVSAQECNGSFYCYGNTASSVVRIATRPPPIPPPNPRALQQRRQAQIALRNSPTPRAAPRTSPRPARVQPTNRVTTPTVRTTPRPAAAPVLSCTERDQRATYLNSQAVLAAKAGERSRAVQLFQEVAKLRRQNCR